jgi:histidinol-phosphate aminotransferase
VSVSVGTAPHGGPDGGPAIAVDFSTNAHPLGANPWVREQVLRTDRARYPDPQYAHLRCRLGDFHQVDPERIVVGASASELIWRVTKLWRAIRNGAVVTDGRTFGEYLRAAKILGVPVTADPRRRRGPLLHWRCHPDNPTGALCDLAVKQALTDRGRGGRDGGSTGVVIADLAYWPFLALLSEQRRFAPAAGPPWSDRVAQLWSPNKLHGLTGVRGAYMILAATSSGHLSARQLINLAPSWVLGADGVAMLEAHTSQQAVRFLRESAPKLRLWKVDQDRRLSEAGWRPQISPLHFGLWRPPIERSRMRDWQLRLRRAGFKLRDATSFGRPGWVRLVSRAPAEVQQLLELTERFTRVTPRLSRTVSGRAVTG